MNIIKKLKNYGGLFEVDKKQNEIKALENEMANPNFWNDKTHSEEIINRLNSLKNKVDKIKNIKQKISSNLIDIDDITEEDSEIINIISEDCEKIKQEYESFELDVLLNGEYDSNNCILEIF